MEMMCLRETSQLNRLFFFFSCLIQLLWVLDRMSRKLYSVRAGVLPGEFSERREGERNGDCEPKSDYQDGS